VRNPSWGPRNKQPIISTWIPTDASGAGLVLTVTKALYTRNGRIVHLMADVTYPATASGAIAQIGGLPSTPVIVAPSGFPGSVVTNGAGNPTACQASSTGVIFISSAGVASTNANCSGAIVRFSVTYFI
jgi:hypothetical protein